MSGRERSTVRNCPNCGATVESRSARYCEFCGYELLSSQTPTPPPPDPAEQRRFLFERLRSAGEFDRLLAHQPRIGPLLVGPMVGIAFGLVMVAMGIGMSCLFGAVGGAPFALVPLLAVVFAIAMLVVTVPRVYELTSSPLLRVPARVLDKRNEVAGWGGGHRSASTRDLVTLEDEHGRRRQYFATSRLAGRIVPGDLGVAFLKGRHLVDFVPLVC